MLKEKNEIFQNAHRALDIFLTIAAFLSAYQMKKYLLPKSISGLSTEPNYYVLLLLCIMIWFVVFKFSGIYRPYRKQAFAEIALAVVKSVSVCLLIFTVVLFFFKQQAVSRLFVGLFVLLDMVFLICSKWIIHTVLGHIRRKGYNFRNIVIIGCHSRADDIIRAVKDHPETGYRIIGRLKVSDNDIEKEHHNNCLACDLPVIGTINNLKSVMKAHVIDEVFVTKSLRTIPDADQFIYKAESMGIPVHLLPEWGLREIGFKPRIGKLRFENVFGQPILSLSTAPDNHPLIYAKNLIDFVVSGIGLVICAIPFLLIAICIKISSKGPVFFKQERVGLNGRAFILYKFRTMIENAESMKHDLDALNESDGPVFKIKNDPRVIPYIGTFLRKTSLDELPQLINVFKGEMSLVGPRPPLREEVDVYDSCQRRRLSMKPGLTCLWQVSRRRNEICFKEWVQLDLKYIDNWSLWCDTKIIFRTVWVMITGSGR